MDAGKFEPKGFPRVRTSRKSATTQIGIIDAYLELMKSVDFDKVSVSDIARAANITRSTFYAYFDDIYDVIGYIESELVEHMPAPDTALASKGTSLAHGLHAPTADECAAPGWLIEWFGYVRHYARQLNALLGPHGNPQFPHKMRKCIREAHRLQARNEGFAEDAAQIWLLNGLSDLQLRLTRDFVRTCCIEGIAPEEVEETQAYSVSFVNLVRIGGRYQEFITHAPKHEA